MEMIAKTTKMANWMDESEINEIKEKNASLQAENCHLKVFFF